MRVTHGRSGRPLTKKGERNLKQPPSERDNVDSTNTGDRVLVKKRREKAFNALLASLGN